MKRLTSRSKLNCRKLGPGSLLLAAFTLFLGLSAAAQSLPAAAEGAASAAPVAATSPTTEQALPGADTLQRPALTKIAAPNALLPAPTWARLSVAQKSALLPLEHDWDGLDSSRKSKWLEVAARFSALPAEDQARMQERMREWARLSPGERQQARVNFHDAKKITADERQAKWEAYQALPLEQRQQLADKAARKLENQAGKAATAKPVGKDDGAPQTKSNLVPAAASNQAPQAVAATLLQARPGATTVLITHDKAIPAHQQAGLTKVLANPDLVDSKTLLPKRAPVSASAPSNP